MPSAPARSGAFAGSARARSTPLSAMLRPMPAVAPREPSPVGTLLREWRQLRKMSQLEVAQEAEVSTRHLSFLETGRSRPSAEMLLVLASVLDLPLRDRNALLMAAGFAP